MEKVKKRMQATGRERRIEREVMEFNMEKRLLGGMTLTPDPNDIHHLTATIPGPHSSPYHGGVFHVDITLPDTYPIKPPEMRFTTKVWHPNISSETGAICLDILKENWTPALNLISILISVQALLSVPEPTAPQDDVVAEQYLTDHSTFTAIALCWTEDFALVSSPEYNRKVQKLIEMGFPEALVKKTLEAVGGHVIVALEKLCS